MSPDDQLPIPESADSETGTTKASRLTNSLASIRLSRLPQGSWYPLLPAISFGTLTAIPFFHAFYKLRERRILLLAIIYVAGAALYISISYVHHPEGWLENLKAVLILWPVVLGTIQLTKLRRRVYLGTTQLEEEKRERGFWYPLLPAISFGTLTAIPFFHAFNKLRERRILLLAIVYSVATALFLFLFNAYGTANANVWLRAVTGGLLMCLIIAGTIQLAKLRRHVYLGTTEVYTGTVEQQKQGRAKDQAIRATIESGSPAERNFSVFSNFISLASSTAFLLAFSSFILLIIPAAAIAQTLTNRANFALPTDIMTVVSVLVITLGATLSLIGWLTVGYKPTDRISRHLTVLGAAVCVNIYLGYSVWIVATRFAHPAASPHKLGLMIWWNLTDSIPLVNINSALDWERPLNEYEATVGWLFLLQRIVLVLTLARVIQIIINRWADYTKVKDKAATAEPDQAAR